jgi:hypothetical protein
MIPILRGCLACLFLLFAALPAWSGDVPTPGEDWVICPQCEGSGVGPCEAPGCHKGKAPCPRTCIKESGPWERRSDDPKHGMWTKVYNGDDHTKFWWFPRSATGHLIEFRYNAPVDAGVCPECKGTGIITCKVCNGTGEGPCDLCKGAKKVPPDIAKAYTDKRDAERAQHAITLTDGTVIYGKVIMRLPDKVVIKTDEGKTVEVAPDKIASEPKPEKKPRPDKKDADPKDQK